MKLHTDQKNKTKKLKRYEQNLAKILINDAFLRFTVIGKKAETKKKKKCRRFSDVGCFYLPIFFPVIRHSEHRCAEKVLRFKPEQKKKNSLRLLVWPMLFESIRDKFFFCSLFICATDQLFF